MEKLHRLEHLWEREQAILDEYSGPVPDLYGDLQAGRNPGHLPDSLSGNAHTIAEAQLSRRDAFDRSICRGDPDW